MVDPGMLTHYPPMISESHANFSARNFHVIYREARTEAKKVILPMGECDIHQTRSIKINSAVNLSRKPGLDLSCDLIYIVIVRTLIVLVPSLKWSFI